MSPDSVAQFLPPGKIAFDIVVFDEASQIVTATPSAMGAQHPVVIGGDSKQMPPTKVRSNQLCGRRVDRRWF